MSRNVNLSLSITTTFQVGGGVAVQVMHPSPP
jgi:hypothetical protein